MAFPTIAAGTDGLQTGVLSTAGTSHVITMPTNIVAGNLLIILFVDSLGTGSTNSFSGSFTALTKINNGTGVGAQVAYKIAAGSDTCTVTTTGSTKSAHCVYQIANWHGTTAPEQSVTTGGASAANPLTLSPSWGSADTLWLEGSGVGSTAGPTAASTNYTNFTTVNSTGGAGGTNAHVSSARRELAAASDDPDAMTSIGTTWTAHLVAIRPSAVAAEEKKPSSYLSIRQAINRASTF